MINQWITEIERLRKENHEYKLILILVANGLEEHLAGSEVDLQNLFEIVKKILKENGR